MSTVHRITNSTGPTMIVFRLLLAIAAMVIVGLITAVVVNLLIGILFEPRHSAHFLFFFLDWHAVPGLVVGGLYGFRWFRRIRQPWIGLQPDGRNLRPVPGRDLS